MSIKMEMHDCKLEKTSYSFLPKLSQNASGKQKLFRKFRKAILISNRVAIISTYFRSQASINYERRRQVYSGHWFVIHPFSNFK